jgi:hypothetical protein
MVVRPEQIVLTEPTDAVVTGKPLPTSRSDLISYRLLAHRWSGPAELHMPAPALVRR